MAFKHRIFNQYAVLFELLEETGAFDTCMMFYGEHFSKAMNIIDWSWISKFEGHLCVRAFVTDIQRWKLQNLVELVDETFFYNIVQFSKPSNAFWCNRWFKTRARVICIVTNALQKDGWKSTQLSRTSWILVDWKISHRRADRNIGMLKNLTTNENYWTKYFTGNVTQIGILILNLNFCWLFFKVHVRSCYIFGKPSFFPTIWEKQQIDE